LKTTKNIIEELGHLVPVKNKHTVTEARAMHVISSAINLIESLKANYSVDLAEDLTKRLIKSIISEDPQKFQRKISQIKKQEKQNGNN
jgi:flagellar biosynthesis/type III secretory pathway protein FliH